MQKKDPENTKINNFQDFLGKEGTFVCAQEEKIRYYEKNLIDLRKLPMKEESNKLISEYVTKIEEIKDKLPELKVKLNNDYLTYQKMLKEYQTKTLPEKYKRVEVIIDFDKEILENLSKSYPFTTIVFAVPINMAGAIKVSYDERAKIIVSLQNFERETFICQWTSIRNSWYKWTTITSKVMKVDF